MARKRRPAKAGKSETSSMKDEKSTGSSTVNEKVDEGKSDSSSEKTTNDPAWYARDERLLIDSASIPYSHPFGARIELKADKEVNLMSGYKKISVDAESLHNKARAVPGIMVYNMVPSYGDSKDRLSPLNVAATALYSQVRYVNNGRKNYDPADLLMYCMVVSDLYSFLNWLRRIYSCAFMYSQANKYVGKALLEAQSIDAESILNNLADFRYWINAFTNKIASYAVPEDITLFYKRAMQYSYVYIEHEGDSIKDGLYMYNPTAFYKFRLDDKQKGMLALTKVGTGNGPELTLDDLRTFGESLLENIWGDEDFGLMSGDILRAFNGKILRIEQTPEEYVVPPVHDRLVLSQMSNSVICTTWIDNDDVSDPDNWALYYTYGGPDGSTQQQKARPGDIVQDINGNLISHHALCDNLSEGPNNVIYPLFDKVVNLHETYGDPATTIENIQNMVSSVSYTKDTFYDSELWKGDALGQGQMSIATIFPGAAYCFKCDYFEWDWRNQSASIQHPHLEALEVFQNTMYAHNTQFEGTGLRERARIMTFKWRPHLLDATYTYDSASKTYTLDEYNINSGVDTYALVTNTSLSQMLEVSLLSLLYVPGVAKYVNSLS